MSRKVPRKDLGRSAPQRKESDNQTQWRREFRVAFASKLHALGLDFDALDLERQCTFCSFEKGNRIMSPGDVSFSLGLVVSGHVITCLRTPRRLIAQLVGPGNAVCLPTALARANATEFCTEAHDKAVIAFVPQEVLEGLVARVSGLLRFGVVAYAVRALSRSLLWKGRLLTTTVAEGLAQEIACIAGTAPGPRLGTVGPRVTHDTLKDFGGWSRAFVTKTLPIVAGVTRAPANRLIVAKALLDAPMPFRRPTPPIARRPVLDPYGMLRAQLRSALRALAIRAAVPTASLERLSEDALLHRYELGERIDVVSATHAVILIDGAARVECYARTGQTIQPVALQVAKSGQLLAFPSALVDRGSPGFIAAVAEQRCLVGLIEQGPLMRMLEELPPRHVLQVIVSCLQIFSRLLCATMRMLGADAVERVWFQLERLALTFPVDDPRGTAIGIPVSRDTLAALAAIPPPGVSRATRRLREIGWIEKVGDRWLLLGFFDREIAA